MSIKRKLKKEISKIEIPSPEQVLGTKYVDESRTLRKGCAENRRRRLVPIVALVLCAVIIGGTAGAAVIGYFGNSDILLNNVQRYESVPEGYVGIYTPEQLDAVRNDLDANYILMSDIDLGAFGEWTPIDSENGGFSGIFNGNGYVIRGLRLRYGDESQSACIGLFGQTNGYFVNLGIEDCRIEIGFSFENANEKNLYVGAVAAEAVLVGGCYVKDTKINVNLSDGGVLPSDPQVTLAVGGVCGVASYVDSCASYADINVNTDESVVNFYGGLCAGRAFSSVTSLGVGKVICNGDAENTPIATGGELPVYVGGATMQKLIERVESFYGESAYETKLFKAHYYELDPTEIEGHPSEDILREGYERFLCANALLGSAAIESGESIYVLDANLSHQGALHSGRMIDKMIDEVFSGYEGFCSFCLANGIKCGIFDCYIFEDESSITKGALGGFDFDVIWTEKDGKITQSIFSK